MKEPREKDNKEMKQRDENISENISELEENEKSNQEEICNCDEQGDCCCDEATCNCNLNEDDCECEECNELDSEKRKQFYKTDLEQKVKEYLYTARRLQAEFDNYRKKSELKLKQARLDGQIQAISKILPALDSFAGASKTIADKKVLEGVCLIEDQLVSALKSLDVSKIKAVGEQFDPNLHNALAVVKDNSTGDNIITEEYLSGYILNDKVIRHSQVIVNKKEEN
ncbi:MAG: nucleotide exchange factor GrpE [Clostridia bacterium]|nr:nucleotide exchange factor GrpE [Clostridia bacterium]MDD4686189.1 nucleotide exchange factor GrpE [Clostridia bacterium]